MLFPLHFLIHCAFICLLIAALILQEKLIALICFVSQPVKYILVYSKLLDMYVHTYMYYKFLNMSIHTQIFESE